MCLNGAVHPWRRFIDQVLLCAVCFALGWLLHQPPAGKVIIKTVVITADGTRPPGPPDRPINSEGHNAPKNPSSDPGGIITPTDPSFPPDKPVSGTWMSGEYDVPVSGSMSVPWVSGDRSGTASVGIEGIGTVSLFPDQSMGLQLNLQSTAPFEIPPVYVVKRPWLEIGLEGGFSPAGFRGDVWAELSWWKDNVAVYFRPEWDGKMEYKAGLKIAF